MHIIPHILYAYVRLKQNILCMQHYYLFTIFAFFCNFLTNLHILNWFFLYVCTSRRYMYKKQTNYDSILLFLYIILTLCIQKKDSGRVTQMFDRFHLLYACCTKFKATKLRMSVKVEVHLQFYIYAGR